ncbi:hypothetical protein R6Q59_002447 [Mikania micrantha]
MKLWATNEVRAKSKFWYVSMMLIIVVLGSIELFVVKILVRLIIIAYFYAFYGVEIRYFLRKLKKSNGQMLAINEIFEKNPTTIKNYGIWLRYQSRTGYHNM